MVMPAQPYRMDGPEDLPEESLLFWPNNPRLKISDFKEVKYTPKQLVDAKNQQRMLLAHTKIPKTAKLSSGVNTAHVSLSRKVALKFHLIERFHRMLKKMNMRSVHLNNCVKCTKKPIFLMIQRKNGNYGMTAGSYMARLLAEPTRPINDRMI
jgi:hypothetical protein